MIFNFDDLNGNNVCSMNLMLVASSVAVAASTTASTGSGFPFCVTGGGFSGVEFSEGLGIKAA